MSRKKRFVVHTIDNGSYIIYQDKKLMKPKEVEELLNGIYKLFDSSLLENEPVDIRRNLEREEIWR